MAEKKNPVHAAEIIAAFTEEIYGGDLRRIEAYLRRTKLQRKLLHRIHCCATSRFPFPTVMQSELLLTSFKERGQKETNLGVGQ